VVYFVKATGVPPIDEIDGRTSRPPPHSTGPAKNPPHIISTQSSKAGKVPMPDQAPVGTLPAWRRSLKNPSAFSKHVAFKSNVFQGKGCATLLLRDGFERRLRSDWCEIMAARRLT
jgi:hypothetical protein